MKKLVATLLCTLALFMFSSAQLSKGSGFNSGPMSTYSYTVKIQGKGSYTMGSPTKKESAVDCDKNPELCTLPPAQTKDLNPADPKDPSGPVEGGEEPTEPAETGGGEDKKEETKSGQKYDVPSFLVIEIWSENKTDKPDSFCVWVLKDGEWRVHKNPRKIMKDLESLITSRSMK